MSREFKAFSFTNIKAKAEGRNRTGICAVFGNVDDWGDRIQPGAFKKTITEGQRRVRHLWNHDAAYPPIASIKSLKELSRDELPEEVLKKSPEASGGLSVTREYYENDLANWVLQAIDKDDVNEMSFAYEVVKSTWTEEEIAETETKRDVRELLELRLFDTSDVNWGMNSATVALAKSGSPMPLGLIYSNFLTISEKLKKTEIPETELKLLELMQSEINTLFEEKAEETEQKTDEREAEAADTSTSLESLGLKIRSFEIENLTI